LTTAPPDELQTFAALQARLAPLFRDVFPDRLAQRTVVVLPSLSLDSDVLARVTAAHHYEERMLGMLMLLRLPRTRVIYLTSAPIPDPVIDYYLQLLPGVPVSHARARLTLLSCHDRGPKPLTEKILERPRLVVKLQRAIGDTALAHLSAYSVTPLERSLAVRLGVPIYGCDPALAHLGSKSGGRALMREAGVEIPDGEENLRDAADITQALVALKRRQPSLKRALVKINEGFSGDGNAVFGFHGAPGRSDLGAWAKARLPHMKFEAEGMTFEAFAAKARDMGAVVEAFVEGEKTSPSRRRSRRTIRCSAAPMAACSSARGFPPTRPTGSTSRRTASASLRGWRRPARSAASASISSACGRATAGGATASRSTCARAARRIRS